MKPDSRAARRRFLMGLWLAAIFGWFCCVFSFVTSAIVPAVLDELLPTMGWTFPLYALLFLASFPLISFGMGMISSFFWHNCKNIREQQDSAIQVLIVFYLPILLIPLVGLVLALLTFYITSLAFVKALNFCAMWWPNRGWRHLFGLANDWEREDSHREEMER